MASLTNGLSKLSIDASPTASSTATSSPPSLQPSSSSDGSSNASSPSLSPTVSRNSSDRSAGRSAANPVSLSKARTHKGFDDVFTKNQLSRRETKKYGEWLPTSGALNQACKPYLVRFLPPRILPFRIS